MALVEDAILDCSRRGGIVLDAFCGSGTTLIATERAGRRGFGLELDPKYIDAALATVRCSIYTRKSSEEGLEQDFNSLQAQREACEAYIASQKHEGWIVLPTFYDDGVQRPV